ncbi:MAG: SufS family cysteine desulfurase [Chlamydiota bacterium]
MFSYEEGGFVRDDFPFFSQGVHLHKPLVYLDSAATTQKPQSVIDRMMQFYLYEYGTVHRAVYNLAANATDCYCLVREQVRAFIGAALAEEVIFTSGTTDSINLVAKSFGHAFLKAGDEILISYAEHHANIVPWQMLAEEKQLILKVAKVTPLGELDLESFKSLLNEKTKLVSLAYMTNTTGEIYPVKELIALAHEKGAKVFLDAAQAASHIAISVKELDVDFLAFSAHKMYGPTGVGVLYGKKQLLEKMPPHKGGGDMITKVTFDKTTYQEPPLRFEAGTPMIAEVIGLGAAIEYIQTLGLDKIKAFEAKLLQEALSQMQAIAEIRFIGEPKNKGPLITFVVKGLHALDVGTLLNVKGVALRTGTLCAQPILEYFGVSSALRISFGVYNTLEDIHRFIHALKETILLLKPEMTSY